MKRCCSRKWRETEKLEKVKVVGNNDIARDKKVPNDLLALFILSKVQCSECMVLQICICTKWNGIKAIQN